MLVYKIGGLTLQFKDLTDLANWIQTLANKARADALSSRTIKQARFQEGKCYAYTDMANLIKDLVTTKETVE